MKYRTVFDIIGPVMIGPSSSHTAGAVRMGRAARMIFSHMPERVLITLYGSFAKTYRGHGTDVALIGGILDFDPSDPRMPDALTIAEQKQVQVKFVESEEIPEHPNTARIVLEKGTERIELVAISIGGGKIEIVELNGFPLQLSDTRPTLLILHQDRYGAVASVATILAQHQVNISYMQVSRQKKGFEALMAIETDQEISTTMKEELADLELTTSVAILAS